MSTAQPHYDRATLLMEQNRHDLAEPHLRQALALDPNFGVAHALLALCLARRKSFAEALDEARRAVGLDPDNAFVHYALASVYDDRDMIRESLNSIRQAIELDPNEPMFWALLASLKFQQKDYKGAVEAAAKGLAINPEHSGCTHVRAMALTSLGRREEAGQAIGSALKRNPDSAIAHANMGWKFLHESQPRKAMDHFREALRLDPTMDWARQGIIEAMKARNFIYRWFLRYMLFMSKLPTRAQWGLILGGYVGYRLLGTLAKSAPDLAPFVWPVLIAYIVFVATSWFAYPVFNLLLCASPFGRAALSPRDKVFSFWLGAALLLAIAALAFHLSTDEPFTLLIAISLGLLCIPIAAVGLIADPARRRFGVVYALALHALVLIYLVGPLLSMDTAALQPWIMWPCVLSLLAVNILNSTPKLARA